MVREARQLHWIDAIVAPSRGGLLFGVIASHRLNVPLEHVIYSSKAGKVDDKNHANALPDMASDVKTILLVDDLNDSGNTMKEIHDYYREKGLRVITAVFHYKEGSVFKPDMYFWHIPIDSPFIDYPYEVR